MPIGKYDIAGRKIILWMKQIHREHPVYKQNLKEQRVLQVDHPPEHNRPGVIEGEDYAFKVGFQGDQSRKSIRVKGVILSMPGILLYAVKQ